MPLPTIARSRPIALCLLVGSSAFGCEPGAATSETQSTESGTSGTDSSTTGAETDSTGFETGSTGSTGVETDTTETSSTTDTTDACVSEGDIDEVVDACGCTVNTCANGNWAACEDSEMPRWCGASSMLRSVTYCASDSFDCGAIFESCKEDFCEQDPDGREYNEEALDCTLSALRDRTPGTYGWQSTLDGNYSGEAGIFHLRADGATWARQCDWADLGTGMDQPSGLDLESPEYFEGCLAKPKPGDRWACMRSGLLRTEEIGMCGAGTGGPPPLGTCADGGIAWAGSAIFEGSDPAALAQLEGVECVEGPLYVDGVVCSDVLDALQSLRRIDGSLTLRDVEVGDLKPLSALSKVGGSIVISGLSQATSLEGLEGVATVPGQLYLGDLPNLESLSGLSGLTSVDTLTMRGLPKLQDLSGLDALTSVEELTMRELGIATLDGLGAVSPTTLEIWDSIHLTSLAGLEGMTSGESVRLLGLSSLTSFAGLANLESAEFFQVSGTDTADLAGLDALAQVSSLSVRGEVLIDVGPLPSLVTLGSLSVDYSSLIKSLSGMVKITALPDALRLSDLPALTDLSGLASVQEIGELDIRDCDGLTDLTGLGAVKVVDSISLDGNASLASVVGLDALGEITQRLIVRENDKLVDMAGMVLAPSVGGRLQFWKNPSLTSLAGMEGVTSIVGDLHVIGNGSLTSLGGLVNMTFVDGALKILDNVQLPTQEALDFAESLEVTGSVEVEGNG